MFLNVCKQTFCISYVRISQEVMWNVQHFIFIRRRINWHIFGSALVTICAMRCARFIIYFNLNSCTKLFYLTFNCFWAILCWPFLYFCNFISSFIASKFTSCFFNFLNYSFWSSFKCISGRFFSMIKKILAVCSLSLSFHLCFYEYFSPIFLINTKNP